VYNSSHGSLASFLPGDEAAAAAAGAAEEVEAEPEVHLTDVHGAAAAESDRKRNK